MRRWFDSHHRQTVQSMEWWWIWILVFDEGILIVHYLSNQIINTYVYDLHLVPITMATN